MGFFVVFLLNQETGKYEFVDRWLNQKSDGGWIERTIMSMGWNPLNVAVAWYWATDLALSGFDDNLNLQKYKKVKSLSPDGQTMIDTLEIDQVISPDIWYKDGSLKKSYS